MIDKDTKSRIITAIEKRKLLFDSSTNVFRIFNGFLEGIPGLVLEIYGSTLLILDHHKENLYDSSFYEEIGNICRASYPVIKTAIVKKRTPKTEKEKKGAFIFGNEQVQFVVENNVKYAVDLQLNQDSGFYIDARNLRIWLKENMAGKTILNTFAYTGSLGVAALSGGAAKVFQTDLIPKFLDIARLSAQINGFPPEKHQNLAGDFFRIISRLKNEGALFDCVIMDPPFFSSTQAGKLDLSNDSVRLVNKVRPIIKHEGCIVLVNNSLFLSGQEFYDQVQTICKDGFVEIKEIIPIASDVTGFADTIISPLPVDPSPFNHATKIVVLKIHRKDKRSFKPEGLSKLT